MLLVSLLLGLLGFWLFAVPVLWNTITKPASAATSGRTSGNNPGRFPNDPKNASRVSFAEKTGGRGAVLSISPRQAGVPGLPGLPAVIQ